MIIENLTQLTQAVTELKQRFEVPPRYHIKEDFVYLNEFLESTNEFLYSALTSINGIIDNLDNIVTIATNIDELLEVNDNAVIAQQQALIATTQAGLAATSEVNSLSYKTDAESAKIDAESALDDITSIFNIQLEEYASTANFPITGDEDTIYIALDTDYQYRWSGTQYNEIGGGVSLGETENTAYRGDRGKTAYDHSQLTHNKTFVGLSNVDNTSDANKPISTDTQTALDIKVDKVTGKGLSTEDYTNSEKNKLSGIETGAEVNNISDTNATDLTDSGESSLHYHSSDRNRSNHTGTQSADSIVDGTTNKVYTSIEKTKLSNIESLADVTDATNIGNSIFNSPSKSTPVNNDILSLLNSESSNALSKFTVLNLKTLLKTYFDAYYEGIGVCIPYSDATATPTANKIPIADSNKLIDNWISKTVVIQVSDPNGDAITSGNGKAFFTVPVSLNGCNIIDVDASLTTASTSGTPTIQIRNVTDSQDVLSTRITVDANEKTSYTASTQPVINTSYDDVSTGDQLAIDIDVAGTGAKGLSVILIFKKA